MRREDVPFWYPHCTGLGASPDAKTIKMTLRAFGIYGKVFHSLVKNC